MSTADERELMSELGFDVDDPEVAASLADAEAHLRLIETLVGVREGRSLKQSEVAARMGTTQSRVSAFERLGGDPRLSTIHRYARAVDAKVSFVVRATPRGWNRAETIRLQPTTSEGAPSETAVGEIQWHPVARPAAG